MTILLRVIVAVMVDHAKSRHNISFVDSSTLIFSVKHRLFVVQPALCTKQAELLDELCIDKPHSETNLLIGGRELIKQAHRNVWFSVFKPFSGLVPLMDPTGEQFQGSLYCLLIIGVQIQLVCRLQRQKVA